MQFGEPTRDVWSRPGVADGLGDGGGDTLEDFQIGYTERGKVSWINDSQLPVPGPGVTPPSPFHPNKTFGWDCHGRLERVMGRGNPYSGSANFTDQGAAIFAGGGGNGITRDESFGPDGYGNWCGHNQEEPEELFCSGGGPPGGGGGGPGFGPANERSPQASICDMPINEPDPPPPDYRWYCSGGDGAIFGSSFGKSEFDATGNVKFDGVRGEMGYDVFGRLASIRPCSPTTLQQGGAGGGPGVRGGLREGGLREGGLGEGGVGGAGLGKFIYDGLGRKIRAIYDTTGPEQVHDGEIGIGDVEEIYLHDLNWRVISIFRKEFGTTESVPACYQQIVYHERGNTDRPIMRRRDADGGVAGDGVLEENLCYITNHRGDVVMLVDGFDGGGGLVKDRVRYSAYGVPELQPPPGDFNRDWEIDSQDIIDFVDALLAEDPAADHNHDGVLEEQDYFDFLDDYWAGGVDGATGEGPYQTDVGGEGVGGESLQGLGHQSNFDNRTGYAGYWWDPFVGLYHVRHRVYDPWQGRWLTRDPIGYSGGMNLYEYCGGDPIGCIDPFGENAFTDWFSNVAEGAKGVIDWATGEAAEEEAAWRDMIQDAANGQMKMASQIDDPCKKSAAIVGVANWSQQGLSLQAATIQVEANILVTMQASLVAFVVSYATAGFGALLLPELTLGQITILGAISSGLGDVAAQWISIGLGAQDKFSWKQFFVTTASGAVLGAASYAFTQIVPIVRNVVSRFVGRSDLPNYPFGSFSIRDWSGYPQYLPKPTGPFRLLEGAEYKEARAAANRANRAIHEANPALRGQQIHEIHPVKFGGDPVASANKVPLERALHSPATNWWNTLQRRLTDMN